MTSEPETPTPIPPLPTDLPERLSYKIKRRLLGPPLTTAQLGEERLSMPLAVGVISPDMTSSSAYGTEEMLIVLLPIFGATAFSLLLPMTSAILVVLIVTMLSYREVVMVYTRAGGSYVVARENFGPRIAQVAAVALLIDYILTVAVQTAAGTAAVVSYPALAALGHYQTWFSVGVVLLLAYGNLRGVREAGRVFAFPMYFYVFSLGLIVVIGLVQLSLGHLHPHPIPHLSSNPTVSILNKGYGVLTGVAIFHLLRSFANGGSSLTGLEAISNSVSAFRRPEGPHARRALLITCGCLGSLVAGVSLLTHYTHAVPYKSGYPTVISQVARDVAGNGVFGHLLFFLVQLSTMLILYTGGNTSFSGFPFLASFVAEDQFLPRQLTHRGHRLAFSNGIIVLAVSAIALLVVTGSHVDKLVALYAIGVFTGFTMAGAGLSRYHLRERESRWRLKLTINLTSAVVSGLVVLIFAVTKFTQGAWFVVVVFPVLVAVFIRLNRQYREESDALRTFAPALEVEPNLRRHIVLLFVDSIDLATLRALRYGRSLRPTQMRAVHFVLDSARADRLQEGWQRLAHARVNLELLECPDRRLGRAAVQLVAGEVADTSTEVTVLLPRRSYTAFIGRILHDRTADKIADVVSRVPGVAATIVPFDPTAPIDPAPLAAELPPQPAVPRRRSEPEPESRRVSTPEGITPVSAVRYRERARVEGRVRSVEVRPETESPVLELVLADDTGGISVVFLGRREIRGVHTGRRLRAEGMVGSYEGHLAMRNPTIELLPDS